MGGDGGDAMTLSERGVDVALPITPGAAPAAISPTSSREAEAGMRIRGKSAPLARPACKAPISA